MTQPDILVDAGLSSGRPTCREEPQMTAPIRTNDAADGVR